MVFALIMSLILYVASITFFDTIFEVTSLDIDFMWKVGVITAASWLPVWSIRKIVEWYDPDAV